VTSATRRAIRRRAGMGTPIAEEEEEE